MKKLCTLVITILVAMLSLIGCSSSSSKESTSTTNVNKENTGSNAIVYKDGTYKGSYDKPDKNGWKSQITIVVQGGKITKVDFNDVDKTGKLKTENDDYEKKMKEKSGVGPKEFIPKLNQKLIDSQTASKVDAITGATQSSIEFKELAKAVLDKAKTGDASETVLTRK